VSIRHCKRPHPPLPKSLGYSILSCRQCVSFPFFNVTRYCFPTADVERTAPVVLRIARVLRKSFGLRTNVESLFTSPARSGFKSLQGVRALNMIALLLCHMVMAKLFLPYLNKTEMSEVIHGRGLYITLHWSAVRADKKQ